MDYNLNDLTLNEENEEPIPFDIDANIKDRREEVSDVLTPFVKPFLDVGYSAAAAFNRGIGSFCTHLDVLSEYIETKTAFKVSPPIWDDAAKIYDDNAEYWSRKAKENGPDFVNELLGEAIGGAIPGVAEFMLNVPYAGLLGAAEAHKESRSELMGALVDGGQRRLLGDIFRAINPLKQYLRAPAMGGVFATQSATEGAPPREIAKAMGTGMLYSASSPGGQMGLNEIAHNLRVQTNIQPSKPAKKPAKKPVSEKYIADPDKLGKYSKKVMVDTKKNLTETSLVNGVPLGELVHLAAANPREAIVHIQRSHITPDRLIEAIRNKGMTVVVKTPKAQRPSVIKNLTNLESVLKQLIDRNKEIITRQFDATLKEGGSTYNLTKGNLKGSKGYAVSIFPDLSKTVKEVPTEKDLTNYYTENYLLLKKYPELAIGTWLDKETNKTHMGISIVIPKSREAAARDLALRYQQGAIFDLEKNTNIPIGKAGKIKGELPNIDARMKEVRRISPCTELADHMAFDLVHWTMKKSPVETDLAFYGTGIKGAEASRKEADPKNWIDRSYFGGEGYTPEISLGTIAYKTAIERKDLYDFNRDPDKLFKIVKDGNAINIFEKTIKEKGFKGYFVHSPEKGVVVAMFEKVSTVQALKDKARTVAPQRTEFKEISKKELIKAKKTELAELSVEDAVNGITEFIRNRRYELNLANYDTNLFVNGLEQTLTKAQREVIPFLIEKTAIPKELKRPDLEKLDVTGLTETVQKIEKHFSEGWKKIQEHSSEMSVKEIENYVTHIWDIPHGRTNEISSWFITNNRFLKKRFISTLEEGIRLGYKPKVLDIAEIIRIHDNVTNKVIANNKFIAKLQKLDLIQRADKAPDDWVYYDHPALRKTLFIPGKLVKGEKISKELKGILEDMGVALARTIPKGSRAQGFYVSGTSPQIGLQEAVRTHVIAHEIGHHLDKTLKLGPEFVKSHENELLEINRKRIEDFKGEGYAETPQEQIAEFFALLFTKPEKAFMVAPGATADALCRMRENHAIERLIDFNFEKQAKDIISKQVDRLLYLPVKVHPDLQKPLEVVFGQRFNHPVVNALESINGILKKTQLSFSLFHYGALVETGIAKMGAWKTLKVVFNLPAMHNILLKNKYPIFEKMAMARKAVRAGVQFGASADIPVNRIQDMLNEWARKTKNIPLAAQATKVLAKSNSAWDKLLWDYLHDSLKLYAFESATSKTMSMTAQRETAQLINDVFGGQNWDVLSVSPKTLQLMKLALLSPDWTYSTVRQALAVTGIGKLDKSTIALRRKAGAHFWIRAMLYFGVGMNVLNAYFRTQDEKDNPDLYEGDRTILDRTMYGNTIGQKTYLFTGRNEDNSERYIRWGKQFRELPELFIDGIYVSPISATLKKLGGKVAPTAQILSKTFTGVSPSGYTDREIADARGWERVMGIAKMIIKSPFPFSSRSMFIEGMEFFPTDLAMPRSKGMSRGRAINFYKIGLLQKNERILKETYAGCVVNNLPAETLFMAALTTVKAESTKEYNRGVRTIQQAADKMATTTNPIEIERLNRTIKRLQKENMDRLIGIRGLEIVLGEAELYHAETTE